LASLRKTLKSCARRYCPSPSPRRALSTESDEYEERYVLDFEMKTDARTATIRSGWIVRRGEGFPRFTTCWVL
jgi:hypothetical protein